MKTKRNVLLSTITLLLALASCARGEVYYRYHHLEKGNWHRDNVLVFPMDSALLFPQKTYDLTIELTTNRSYPYKDLWVTVDHNLMDTLFHRDTLHVRLANEQGVWLGSGTGGLHQLSIPYLNGVRPSPRDSITGYSLQIQQMMHDNPLRGIEKVGLTVKEKNHLLHE